MPVRTTLRRRLLATGAAVLAPLLLLATPGTAEAATTRDRADAAAGWLGRQLDPDTHLVVGEFGPVYGQTADIVLALHAAKTGRGAAGDATRALRRTVLAYTGGGDQDEFYAGAFAKLLVVAAVRGGDPHSFGTSARRDLVAQLRSLECGPRRAGCAAGDRGRFSDRSQFGDFSNAITQSLALVGLSRATRPGPSAASVRFLVDQQCDNGAFPEAFGKATCSGSVDATGFAVQALVTVGTPSATAAAGRAAGWLVRRQHGDGSFSGNGERNANSTSLAAQALNATGRAGAEGRAVSWLRAVQVGCGAAAAERGRVRYTADSKGDPVLATSQAVPALAGQTLADVSRAGTGRGLPRLAC